MKYNFTVLETRQQILDFKTDWKFLHCNCENISIYNSFDFVFHSICEFNDPTLKSHIIVIYQQNILVAIFPFQIYFERRYFINFRTLEYAAQDEIDKPKPIIKIGHEENSWQGLFIYLNNFSRHWDLISLMEVSSTGNDKNIVRKLSLESNYSFHCNDDKSGPLINLNTPWISFWNSHKKMRKKIHKIETDYKDNITFRVNSLPWALALEQYIKLENRSWKNGKIGIGQDSESKVFYEKFYQCLAKSNQLHFGFLYVNQQLISAEIAYSLNDKIYFSHGCYDQSFKKYSPGMVSTSYFIKHFMNGEYNSGDFLCGYSGYMNSWSESILKTSQIEIYNNNIKNKALFIYRAIKKSLITPIKSTLVKSYAYFNTIN
jgi:GNAT acetyltransferase-like protein